MNPLHNLSICCVDGITIRGLISDDKKRILEFLDKYDHEGSGVNLVIKEEEKFQELNGEEVYKYLREEK